MSIKMSLTGFAAFLAAATLRVEEEQRQALERAAQVVEAEAKRSLGHYQEAAGPFAGWAALAEATRDDRVHHGYPEDEPLLRDGTLRDSIGHAVDGDEAVVGSNDPVAEYQELGTDRIPPRSFLGGAAVRKGEEVARIVGRGVTSALVGGGVHEGRMEIPGEE